jgi:fatty acid desaturase
VKSDARRRRAELPTWILAAAIYGGWGALTWWWHDIPLAVGVPLAAWLMAWHGSLQHEAIHGHPTGRPAIDSLVAGAPLSLWLPFPIYRQSHIAHHRTSNLTDPLDDPESFYLTGASWRRCGAVRRALLVAMQTVAGRLLLGPPVAVARLLGSELRLVLAGDRRRAGIWAVHLVGASLVLLWVVGICRISPVAYVLCFVYPGLSLTLLRSFTEHRPAPEQAARTAIIEAGPVLSLLYLNNNLHVLHHAQPTLPWYRLPVVYRERRAELLDQNGGFLLAGYGEVLRRYALRRKDSPIHPVGELPAPPAASRPAARR